MLKRFAATLLLLATPAWAEKQVTCHVDQVIHTRYGVLVHCTETFPDDRANKTEQISFFAPEARLLANQNGIKPQLTVAETMHGFEEVALEAFRSGRPLLVVFSPGSGPGQLFDCWNENCRFANSWAVSK